MSWQYDFCEFIDGNLGVKLMEKMIFDRRIKEISK